MFPFFGEKDLDILTSEVKIIGDSKDVIWDMARYNSEGGR